MWQRKKNRRQLPCRFVGVFVLARSPFYCADIISIAKRKEMAATMAHNHQFSFSLLLQTVRIDVDVGVFLCDLKRIFSNGSH